MSAPAGFYALPLPIAQLSLDAVLRCGQSFRWFAHPLFSPADTPNFSEPKHEYRFALQDRVICLRQSHTHLFYRSIYPDHVKDASQDSGDTSTLAWIHDYFQLDVDLVKLYSEWSSRDDVFRRTVNARFTGIRILRQDPWENVASFICSSNNHISRITKMVLSLCTEFSPPLVTCTLPPVSEGKSSQVTYHAFPPPYKLAHPDVVPRLRELGFGYRAEYIQKTAQLLCDEHPDPLAFLGSLRNVDVKEARIELLKLHGVGPKVADCVLLMSLDKHNIVPVDTHVHQIAVKHYNLRVAGALSKGKTPMTPKIYEAVGKRLREIWGAYAGWAQSVLFTSDLKSFENYGLPTPALTPKKERVKGEVGVERKLFDVGEVLETPTRLRPRKRKVYEGSLTSPTKPKKVRVESSRVPQMED